MAKIKVNLVFLHGISIWSVSGHLAMKFRRHKSLKNHIKDALSFVTGNLIKWVRKTGVARAGRDELPLIDEELQTEWKAALSEPCSPSWAHLQPSLLLSSWSFFQYHCITSFSFYTSTYFSTNGLPVPATPPHPAPWERLANLANRWLLLNGATKVGVGGILIYFLIRMIICASVPKPLNCAPNTLRAEMLPEM